MTSLFIATPAKPALLHTAYTHSLLGSLDALRAAGIEASFHTIEDCIVGRARCGLVAYFMASDATHLWFIDSDMGWKPDAPLRLLAHDLDLVAGCSADRYGTWTTFGKTWAWKNGLIQTDDYIGLDLRNVFNIVKDLINDSVY